MKFKFTIEREELYSKYYEVEADSLEEAEKIAYKYNEEVDISQESNTLESMIQEVKLLV